MGASCKPPSCFKLLSVNQNNYQSLQKQTFLSFWLSVSKKLKQEPSVYINLSIQPQIILSEIHSQHASKETTTFSVHVSISIPHIIVKLKKKKKRATKMNMLQMMIKFAN